MLRLGVVGLGRAAASMLPSLVHHPHVAITAAADLRREALDKFRTEFQTAVYESIEDLCRSPNVDALYIATPHAFHAEHVVTAARHGKHAIVEKPMALTLADCEAMNAAVEQAGVKLVVGHTHSFDPPILKIREIVRSGELGRLRMIHTWNFTDFLYRPRRPEELDTRLGGGIIFNQLPHQIDMLRWIGGGLVKSVRAATGIWDPARPTEGSHVSYIEFLDGTTATAVYSGYDHFNSDELHSWIGESGEPRSPDRHGAARREWKKLPGLEQEAALKAATGYGGAQSKRTPLREHPGPRHHPHFGITLVSCEKGDLRPSRDGVLIYSDEGKREIPVPLGRAVPDKGKVIDEFYESVVSGRRPAHDGRWGKATLEVCLAIQRSAKERKEVALSHQVPVDD